MEKIIEKRLSSKTNGKLGLVRRVYGVVDKHVELVQLGFLLPILGLFIGMPLLLEAINFNHAYMEISLFAVVCVSVVVVLFLLAPCFILSCMCERGDRDRYTLSYLVCWISFMFYAGWIFCGICWLFTDGSGMKLYAWCALAWLGLCWACAYKLWKKLLDEF